MKLLTTSLLAVALSSSLYADQVIADDLIVQFSGCFGNDCVDGESFGFDTIRLKENNLRIRAVDTSATSSFPSNDWQITFNDSANGGVNKFSIDDIDGGRTPFTIEASAPSNSLYVDDSGRIGLGTTTPVVEIHNVDGDTPTLRLEQDGSSGFTPQTWDVAGNETNFFIRDATNGSTLPFRIRPGAPSSSIDIAGSGNVGIGTASPQAKLDVVGGAIIGTADTPATLLVHGEINATGPIGVDFNGSVVYEANKLFHISMNNTNLDKKSDAGFSIRNNREDFTWVFRTWEPNSGFSISKYGNGANKEFLLYDEIPTDPTTVKLVLSNGASCDGTWNNASSRALKKDIKPLNHKEAMEAFNKLQPVTYVYKARPNDFKVGFIAEDVPDLVANPERKSLSSMDMVALLTKVVQLQEKDLKVKSIEMEAMQKRLLKVESLLTNLAVKTSSDKKEKISINLK